MIINETLARALKDRFFDDFQRDATACYKEIKNIRVDLHKRSRWVKAARADLNRFRRFSLGLYEGGSTRRPYFVANILAALEDRPFNAWNEKCLFSAQILYSFEPLQIRWFPGLFNIGEHAVSRLYLRSPVEEDASGSLIPYSVLKQLRYVPFWTTFWAWIDYLMQGDGADFRGDMAPFVPAPDGLFLAKFSKDQSRVEIRTFVGDRHISDERRFIRELMIGISEPLLQSPMSASPAVEAGYVDCATVILTAIVCKKLLPHAEALAKLLFRDSQADPQVQRVFVQHLQHYADVAEGGWWDDFHSMPLRDFLTDANRVHHADAFQVPGISQRHAETTD